MSKKSMAERYATVMLDAERLLQVFEATTRNPELWETLDMAAVLKRSDEVQLHLRAAADFISGPNPMDPSPAAGEREEGDDA